jgi:hypothetical protein
MKLDTEKLITVTVWATLALIAYEALKGVFASTTSNASLGASYPLTPAAPFNYLGTGNPSENAITQDALIYNDPLSPSYFGSGAEVGTLGDFGF